MPLGLRNRHSPFGERTSHVDMERTHTRHPPILRRFYTNHSCPSWTTRPLRGRGAGVIIRWHRTGKTLTLAEEKLGLRLSLHSSATLKTAESAVFSAGVGTTQQQAPNHLSLPYLWRFERRPTGENALGTPRANDWQEVREALRSLFQIWAEQTPFLSVAGWCKNLGGLAFNLVNQAPKGCTLSVVHDPHDGLTVHLHDQPGITSDLSSDEMIARGWHMRLPLLNSWSAFYDFDSTSAETAADLIVKELSLQEGTTPLDIALTDPGESDELRLSLPGLPFHQR